MSRPNPFKDPAVQESEFIVRLNKALGPVYANALQGAQGPNGAAHMLTNTCVQGKILYQNLLNSLE